MTDCIWARDAEDLIFTYTVHPTVTKREHRGSKGPPRWCRFCNGSAPGVTFRGKAHVIPQALGNRTLLSLEECDGCNGDAGRRLETDLISHLGLSRVMCMGAEAKLKPHQAGGAWIESRPRSRELIINLDPDDPRVQFLPCRDGLRLEIEGPSYRPANVARALARLLLFTVSREELHWLRHLIDWVRGDDLWAKPRFYKLTHRGQTPDGVYLMVYRDRHWTGATPRMPRYRVDLRLADVQLIFLPPDRLWRAPAFEFSPEYYVETYEHPPDFVIRRPVQVIRSLPADFVRATDEEVALVAYYRWIDGGRCDGTALEDWYAAEAELTRRQGFVPEPRGTK